MVTEKKKFFFLDDGCFGITPMQTAKDPKDIMQTAYPHEVIFTHGNNINGENIVETTTTTITKEKQLVLFSSLDILIDKQGNKKEQQINLLQMLQVIRTIIYFYTFCR